MFGRVITVDEATGEGFEWDCSSCAKFEFDQTRSGVQKAVDVMGKRSFLRFCSTGPRVQSTNRTRVHVVRCRPEVSKQVCCGG